jgi:hypothetical protein
MNWHDRGIIDQDDCAQGNVNDLAIIGRVRSGVRCDAEKGVVSPRFDV